MKCTIDRITGEYAIILSDNGLAFTLPLSIINALEAHESDILHIEVDREQTDAVKQSARAKLNALFARTTATQDNE